MASTADNKPFHTYENVGYDEHLAKANITLTTTPNNNLNYAPPSSLISATSTMVNSALTQTCNTTTINNSNNGNNNTSNNANNNNSNSNNITFNNGFAQSNIAPNPSIGVMPSCGNIAVNKAALDSPFTDPILVGDSSTTNSGGSAKILSTTDSTGTTRMLTSSTGSSRSGINGQNLVTKLITFPPQSPMDSLKEWSLSTFKCTKQLINEKRGLCPVTNDSQLQNDIEQLRANREKLVQMLRLGQQMVDYYGLLVRNQKQMHSLMNEMSVKCFSNNSILNNNNNNNQASVGSVHHKTSNTSKQVVANFSSLSNNLSSTTTTQASPTRGLPPHHHHHHSQQHHDGRVNSIEHFEDLLPVLNHMKTFTDTNLVDDFKKNAITLNVAIKNGEKLIAALNFYCSNLSTLINKTIEDTLTTVKQFESARIEYDAEKNSLNLGSSSSSSSAQASMTYSSDKVELARLRYEQLKQDVQVKMRFLEENTIKVMHKQLLLFNGAFASYTSGNTAALDTTLKTFSIRDG